MMRVTIQEAGDLRQSEKEPLEKKEEFQDSGFREAKGVEYF